MKTQQHILDTPFRRITVDVTPTPTTIEVRVNFSKPGRLGDEKLIENWYIPLLTPYDSDPRPLSMVNPFTSEHSLTYTDFTIITPPNPLRPSA